MKNCLVQLKYFQYQNALHPDPLEKKSFLHINDNRVQILFRQFQEQFWKYCLAVNMAGMTDYIFLKIWSKCSKQKRIDWKYLIEIQLQQGFLLQRNKNIFNQFTLLELNKVMRSVSELFNNNFVLKVKSRTNGSKKLYFNCKMQGLLNGFQEGVVKTAYFIFQLATDRLNCCKVFNDKKKMRLSFDLATIRLSSFYRNLNIIDQQKTIDLEYRKLLFQQLNQQVTTAAQYNYILHPAARYHKQKVAGKQSSIKNRIRISFEQNMTKRKQIEEKIQKSENERRSKQKQERILTNMQIIESTELQSYQLQTKFSRLKLYEASIKPITTHINRRQNYCSNEENKSYFNLMVAKSSTKNQILIKKSPLVIENIEDNHFKIEEHNNKARNVYLSERNCIQIMKEDHAINICPFFVSYNEFYSLYSKYFSKSLNEWFQSSKSYLNQISLLSIFLQTLNGLEQIGCYRLIHRDLKPQNILLDQSSPQHPVVKLIDFGSAIYQYCDSAQYEERVQRLFEGALRTTEGYGMDYRTMIKIAPELRDKFKSISYNRHQKFDIYSMGKIIEEYKHFFKEKDVIMENLQYLISQCVHLNPDRRLSVTDISLFLSTLTHFYAEN